MSSTRTRKKTAEQPRWVFVTAANFPDPRVPVEHPEYGKRTVAVVFGIDSRGLLWRGVDTDAPVMLGTPPPLNALGG